MVCRQVATVFIPSGVVATSASSEDELRESLLDGYKNNVHPPNDVILLFSITYLDCPTLSAVDNQIVSRVVEVEVLIAVVQPV